MQTCYKWLFEVTRHAQVCTIGYIIYFTINPQHAVPSTVYISHTVASVCMFNNLTTWYSGLLQLLEQCAKACTHVHNKTCYPFHCWPQGVCQSTLYLNFLSSQCISLHNSINMQDMQFYATNTKSFNFSEGGGTAGYFILYFFQVFKSHFIFITSMTQF